MLLLLLAANDSNSILSAQRDISAHVCSAEPQTNDEHLTFVFGTNVTAVLNVSLFSA